MIELQGIKRYSSKIKLEINYIQTNGDKIRYNRFCRKEVFAINKTTYTIPKPQ